MSGLVEAARRLAESDVVTDCDDGYCCVFCGGPAHISYGGRWQISHEDACAWLQLPAIVRALEAAEAMIARERDEDGQFLLGRGLDVWVPEAAYLALEDALSGAAGGGPDDQPVEEHRD